VIDNQGREIDEHGRPEPPRAGAERETLDGFLDFLRATILWKLSGLDEAALRARPLPSSMSLLGMVKHLAYVERSWFQRVFAGREVTFPWTEADPDADWRIEPGETAADVIAFYQAEVAESRRIAAAAVSLDELARRADRGVSLRWIVVHMIEETARHCGHADLLREALDGATGE